MRDLEERKVDFEETWATPYEAIGNHDEVGVGAHDCLLLHLGVLGECESSGILQRVLEPACPFVRQSLVPLSEPFNYISNKDKKKLTLFFYAFCNAILNQLVHLFGDLSFHYQKQSITQVIKIKNRFTLFPYVGHVLAL